MLLLGALVASALLRRLHHRARRDRRLVAPMRASQRTDVKGRVKVSALYVFPIKSCAGVSVGAAHIDRLGFSDDRRMMVVQRTEADAAAEYHFVTECRLRRLLSLITKPSMLRICMA